MAAPGAKKIKKGEMLFNEGDASKSMYFVQSGMIRLFKKKGNSSIELGMIRKGEVIGEMGFLDGGARSASAEAIQDVELVEITNANLAEQLKILPPWLIVLLKTVVNRLRNANNKILQLESASTAYTYGSEGVSTTYQFLSVYDVMKILTAILVSATRNAQDAPGGFKKVALARINRYAQQIIGIQESKIEALIDVMESVGLAKVDRTILDKIEVYLQDLDQVELLINYINDENLKEHAKKTTITVRAVVIMGYMVKHLASFPPNAEGLSEVNMAQILKAEKEANNGKDAFRMDEFPELVKNKLATEPAFKNNDTILTKIQTVSFTKLFKIHKFLKQIDMINDKKREQASKTAPKYSR